MILGENSSRFFDTNTDLGVEPKDYSYCDSVSEAAMTAMYENEQNWNSLINAINVSELQYALENAGAEMQYEAVDLGKIANSAVAVVKEWLSKALGVIQTFAAKVASTFKSAEFKAFVALNKKNISKNGNKTVSYTGYKFSTLEDGFAKIIKLMDANVNYIKGINTKLNTGFDKGGFKNDTMKSGIEQFNTAAGKSAQELVDAFLGGKEETTCSFKEALKYVDSAQKITKDINENSKACNSFASQCIKIINNHMSEFKGTDNKAAANAIISMSKKACTASMYQVQASLKILAIEFSQAKMILKKANKGETVKKPKNESTDIIEFGGFEYALV